MSAAKPPPLPAAKSPPRRFRWKIAAVILLVALLASIVSWNYYAGDLTMQIFWLYPIVSGSLFALFWWWVLLSGLRWKTRLKGLGVLAVFVGLWMLVLKFDSFDGAMIPNFSSRWVHPAWPAVAYLAALACLVTGRLSWKFRAAGLGLLAGIVALSVGVFGFEGFQLKSRPDWKDLANGPRSEESKRLAKRLRKEEQRFAAAASQPANTVRLGEYTPAEFLRLKKIDSWERWQFQEGFATAAGCAPRALFRGNRPAAEEDEWPNFRGPSRHGRARGDGIRFEWTNDKPPPNLWKSRHPLGKGWSSFAVMGGRAITQEQRDGEESIVCYDFRYGTEIWKHADEARFESVQGGVGPRATPTVVGRRVYTLGATGLLNCLDLLNGRLYWQRNILDDAGAENLNWGMAGSPLVAGNLVIVNPGRGNHKAVIAYDRFTGKMVWAAGNEPAAFCTPTIRTIHGVGQLLIFNGEGLFAYDPNSGRTLWSFPWTNDPKINVALPIVQENRILISSGYTAGSVLLQVDVLGGQWSVREVWRQKRFRLKFNDAVLQDGYVYGLDETILTCLRFDDGKILWRRRGSQLGPGGNFGYGQVLLVGRTLLITGENGWVSFVTATPRNPQYLGGFQALNRGLGLLDTKGTGWNPPALCRGRLLLRNELEVACYDLTAR